MMQTCLRVMVLLLLCAASLFGLQHALGDAKDQARPAARSGAWQPAEQDRSAYRDIIDFNIFRSDRSTIARQVDRDRNPPKPEDPKPPQTVRTPDAEPEPVDPDTLWRLTGISHDNDGATAYLENTSSGQLQKLDGPADFSQGEVTMIGYDAIVYAINDQRRVIRVGQTLVGERAAPPTVSTGTGSGSSTSGTPTSGTSLRDLSPAERLRVLRERRAREQGLSPPAAENDNDRAAPNGTAPDATPAPAPAD